MNNTRNEIKQIDFDKIENEVIDCIKWEIKENENGWWEIYKKDFNKFIPLDELINCLLNSNEINECVGEKLGIDYLTDDGLDIIIENTIKKNYKLIEETYNNQIELEK